MLRDRPLSVIRVRPGQEPFMQKNVPKYTPDWVRRSRCGPRRPSARSRTRCATTAGRCCGSPTSGRSSTTRRWSGRPLGPHDPPDPRPRPARGRRRSTWSRGRAGPAGAGRRGLAGAVKTSGAKGLHVFVPIDEETASRTWPPPPGPSPRGPSASTPTSPRPRSSGRTAAARCSSTPPGRRGDRGRRVQPAGPARRAGVVPGGLGRPRQRHARRLHRAPRPDLLADGDPWAELMPAPQRLPDRPGRGGPRHPDRPGAGHARGQAPGEGRRALTVP